MPWLLIMLLMSLAAPQWTARTAGRFTLQYLPVSEKLVRSLEPQLEPELRRVSAALRVAPPSAVRVVMMPDRNAFAGRSWEMWASGMAAPGQMTIYLRPLGGAEVRHNSMRAIIAHELAHLAFYQRLRGQPVPAWLEEGVAVHLANEPFYSRADRLMSIAVSGRAFMFRDLQHGFPSSAEGAAVAYAQSGDFVRFLVKNYGEGAFQQYLDQLATGKDWDEAFYAAFGRSLYDEQMRWENSLHGAYGWLPALFGGGLLWFLLALLAVYAWARKWMGLRRERLAGAAAEGEWEARRQPGGPGGSRGWRRTLYVDPMDLRHERDDGDHDGVEDWYEDEGLTEDGLPDEDEDGEDPDRPRRRRVH